MMLVLAHYFLRCLTASNSCGIVSVFLITCNYSAQLHVGMLCVAVKKVGVLRDRECLLMK
jgi:hypothetical protein